MIVMEEFFSLTVAMETGKSYQTTVAKKKNTSSKIYILHINTATEKLS